MREHDVKDTLEKRDALIRGERVKLGAEIGPDIATQAQSVLRKWVAKDGDKLNTAAFSHLTAALADLKLKIIAAGEEIISHVSAELGDASEQATQAVSMLSDADSYIAIDIGKLHAAKQAKSQTMILDNGFKDRLTHFMSTINESAKLMDKASDHWYVGKVSDGILGAFAAIRKAEDGAINVIVNAGTGAKIAGFIAGGLGVAWLISQIRKRR